MKPIMLVSVVLAALVALPLRGQSVTAGSVRAPCGKTIRVPVTVENVSGLVALEFRLDYDASLLTAKSVMTGDLTTGFHVASNLQSGWAKVAMATGNAVAGGGSAAIIVFEVAANVAGDAPLALSQVLLNDTAVEPADGTVTIECRGHAKPDPAP